MTWSNLAKKNILDFFSFSPIYIQRGGFITLTHMAGEGERKRERGRRREKGGEREERRREREEKGERKGVGRGD